MDVVVTLPKTFGLDRWIAEGDPAGAPWSGTEWAWTCGGKIPDIQGGERVYVVHDGRLRGYAPLVRLNIDVGDLNPATHLVICRFQHTIGLKGMKAYHEHPAEIPARVEVQSKETGLPIHYRRFALVRRGGAVAVTIDEHITGFRGWRYRWWPYDLERPFPEWQIP